MNQNLIIQAIRRHSERSHIGRKLKKTGKVLDVDESESGRNGFRELVFVV